MAATSQRQVKGVHAGGAAWLQLHASIAVHALHLLCTRGYGAFTVDNLAAASGINRRTIYRHYLTRSELAVAAIRQMPTFDAAWNSSGGTPRERVRKAVRTLSDQPVLLPGLLATAVTSADEAPALLGAVTEYVLDPRASLVRRLIQEGQDEGWVRAEASEWEVTALINGLMCDEALGRIHFTSRDARAEALADAIWRQLAIDPTGDGRST